MLIAIWTFVFGLLPFLVLDAVLQWTRSFWWVLAATLVSAVVVFPLTRLRWTRWAARGWLGGCVLAWAVLGVFILLT